MNTKVFKTVSGEETFTEGDKREIESERHIFVSRHGVEREGHRIEI